MNRRNFLKTTGGGLGGIIAAGAMPIILFCENKEYFNLYKYEAKNLRDLENHLFTGIEVPNCDNMFFKAAPSIRFSADGTNAYVNIVPEEKIEATVIPISGIQKEQSSSGWGKKKNMDFKPIWRNEDNSEFRWAKPTYTITQRPANLNLGLIEDSKITYVLKYRHVGEKIWKYSDEYTAISPLVNVKDRGEIIIAYIGDMHLADDADVSDDNGEFESILKDEDLRKMRINGDIVNIFLEKIEKDPDYRPVGEETRMMSAWANAKTLYQLKKTGMDFNGIYIMGDFNPMGFNYKWQGLGLPRQHPVRLSPRETAVYSEFFQIYMRKVLSYLSPFFEINLVLGNHDAEQGFRFTKDPVARYRMEYFPHPGFEAGCGELQNYYFKKYGELYTSENEDGVAIVVNDSERYLKRFPLQTTEYTLGSDQKQWLEDVLKEALNNIKNKQLLIHRSLGSSPGDAGCYLPGDPQWGGFAYSRFFFDYDDILKLNKKFGLNIDPAELEQMWLVDLMADHGVDVYYGHDHNSISMVKESRDKRRLNATCVGASKYLQEHLWIRQEVWKTFYGKSGGYGKSASGEADFWGTVGVQITKTGPDGVKTGYLKTGHSKQSNIPRYLPVGEFIPQSIKILF